MSLAWQHGLRSKSHSKRTQFHFNAWKRDGDDVGFVEEWRGITICRHFCDKMRIKHRIGSHILRQNLLVFGKCGIAIASLISLVLDLATCDSILNIVGVAGKSSMETVKVTKWFNFVEHSSFIFLEPGIVLVNSHILNDGESR